MSEPVGNAPRVKGEIPGNTLKDRETKSEVEPREKEEKIIEGKVITRKPPWYKRFARSLIADDVQNIGDYVLSDVIAPAARNLLYDIIAGCTYRTLYGTGRNRSRGVLGDRPGLRSTRYDRMSEPEPRRVLSRESRARHDFDDVVLETRSEAVDVVEAIIHRVDRYGSASVSDLYDLVGVTGSYADQRWGWSGDDLRTADVRQVRGGFLLDLPLPNPLR